MAQCRGTTKSGSQCRRQAPEGSDYCSIHTVDPPSEEQRASGSTFDLNETLKVIAGVVVIGAIAYLFGGLRRPRLF